MTPEKIKVYNYTSWKTGNSSRSAHSVQLQLEEITYPLGGECWWEGTLGMGRRDVLSPVDMAAGEKCPPMCSATSSGPHQPCHWQIVGFKMPTKEVQTFSNVWDDRRHSWWPRCHPAWECARVAGSTASSPANTLGHEDWTPQPYKYYFMRMLWNRLWE